MEGELGVGMWVILIRLFFGDCGHDHGGELGVGMRVILIGYCGDCCHDHGGELGGGGGHIN